MQKDPDEIIELSTDDVRPANPHTMHNHQMRSTNTLDSILDHLQDAYPSLLQDMEEILQDPNSWEYAKSVGKDLSGKVQTFFHEEVQSGKLTSQVNNAAQQFTEWLYDDHDSTTDSPFSFIPLDNLTGDTDNSNQDDFNSPDNNWWLGRLFPYFKTPKVRAIAESIQWGSIGTLIGYCVGSAVKRFGMEFATWAGMGFIVVQVLSHFGYIESVRYDKMYQDLADFLGVGPKKDKSGSKASLRNILTKDLPSAAGFSTGLMIGLCK